MKLPPKPLDDFAASSLQKHGMHTSCPPDLKAVVSGAHNSTFEVKERSSQKSTVGYTALSPATNVTRCISTVMTQPQRLFLPSARSITPAITIKTVLDTITTNLVTKAPHIDLHELTIEFKVFINYFRVVGHDWEW